MRTIKLLLAFVLSLQLANAQQSGDLDPTFGTNGMVQTFFGDQGFRVDALNSICLQPDGKIIAAGFSLSSGVKSLAYVRYNQNGSLDTSFGENGKIIIPIPSGINGYVLDVEVLEDGKILSCGYTFDGNTSATQPVLVKMNADGSLDTSFGKDGMVVGTFPENCLSEKMRVQKDGKILLAGYYKDNMFVSRYNSDGSIDSGFGEDGLSVVLVEGSIDNTFAKDLALQEDGKIVLTGIYSSGLSWKWLIARVNTDGSIDNTFGEGGLKQLSLGDGHDFSTAVEVRKDGKIIVAGHSWDRNDPILQYSIAVVCLNTDGSLDNSFGQSGIFRKQLLEEGQNYATALALSPEENIYVGLSVVKRDVYDMGILSLDKNGKINTAFSQNGYIIVDIAQDNSTCIALQSDGKIILGGKTLTPNEGTPFTLLRYLSDIPSSTAPVVDEAKESFIVYPNPVKDVLNIKHEGDFGVRIFDLSGRLVLSTENTRTIDVKALTAGTYVIKLMTEDGTLAERFIKL